MGASDIVKQAAEKQGLMKQIADLQTKVTAFEKRAAAEAELLAICQNPHAPLDLKPCDIEDFMTKRAELEAMDDLRSVRTAVKIASRGQFTVGQEADGVSTDRHISSRTSKADRDFEEAFLATDQ